MDDEVSRSPCLLCRQATEKLSNPMGSKQDFCGLQYLITYGRLRVPKSGTLGRRVRMPAGEADADLSISPLAESHSQCIPCCQYPTIKQC